MEANVYWAFTMFQALCLLLVIFRWSQRAFCFVSITGMISLNFHRNRMRYILLLTPFYWRGNKGLMCLCNILHNVTGLLSDRAGIHILTCKFNTTLCHFSDPNPSLTILATHCFLFLSALYLTQNIVWLTVRFFYFMVLSHWHCTLLECIFQFFSPSLSVK